MTDFRALCAELARVLELSIDSLGDFDVAAFELIYDARTALAQPEPEGPTDEELDDLFVEIDQSGEALSWRAFARAVLARWGRPTPKPAALADVHYEWELEDAKGDWQAGGSANSLDDVEREGMRYLQTYAQDGPHKLIIRQHCTETINEITSG